MNQLTLTPLAEPVTATVEVPGSKSYTNRALLLAAMTPGAVKIIKPLISDDTDAMLSCLDTLGITFDRSDDHIDVIGDVSQLKDQECTLDANLSGTTIRFLLALSVVIPGTQILTGGEGLLARPIGDMVDALRDIGADITYLGKEGFPPLKVSSSKLSTRTVKIAGSTSSQYLSALLMVAPLIGELQIEVIGELISKPYVDMTIDTMRQFGVQVQDTDYKYYRIATQQSYKVDSYKVEGDVSSASYFFAMAALTKSTITVKNLNPKSVQADMEFLSILECMGNEASFGNDEITIKGNGIYPDTVDMESCPDQAMTMAVLAAFANGITTIKGVQSLRIKETERVAAVEQELQKMGIATSSTHDTLTIHGGNPQPATIATYGDHRMAMSFAVAGSKLTGMEIHDPQVVGKTFPGFWDTLASVGVGVQEIEQNIVLIGMRGSGKTTVASQLAKDTGREVLDIDSMICEKAGTSIPELIEQHGWDYFRDLESEIVDQIAPLTGKIISTGGGVIMRPANVKSLKKHGFVIYLDAQVLTLTKRLVDTSDRPALTAHKTLDAELKQLLTERKPLYESAADITLATDELNPTQVAQQIAALVEGSKL